MIELYTHNQIAYKATVELLSRTGKAAVIHPTGTGKSFIAFKLCEDRPDACVVWVSPSEYIWRTQLENLKAAGGNAPGNVSFLTYAKLMLLSDEERGNLHPDLIILDEFHRCGAEEWGKGVQALLELYPDAQLLGLTATPIRYLDAQRDMVDELFDGYVAHEMTLSEAIVQGVLPAPKYVLSLYAYQNELDRYLRRAQKVGGAARQMAERLIENLRRRLEQAEGVSDIFEKHLPDPYGKYLIFCADREHMQKLRALASEWFGRIDPCPHIYEVYAENACAREAFQCFQLDESAHLKLLYCIDMLNEGVHVEGLDGVILCRTTISPIVYKQQIGRALSASASKQPVIFDLVNNVDNLYCISALRREMEAVITYYTNARWQYEIAQQEFELIDEVRECRELFEQLEETLSIPWEMMYAEACAYYHTHGDLNVPKRYRTDANLALGNWIHTQRRVWQGTCRGVLTEERIAKLNAIGMVWQSAQESGWENGFAHAKSYRDTFGHLDVPVRYVCSDGFQLGKWICNQRSDHASKNKRRSLDAERFTRLDELGMIWDRTDYGFERGYASAERYVAMNGHLQVPSNYVDEDGFKLGIWLKNQRSKGNDLALERRQRLEALGLRWEGRYNAQWEQAFEKAKMYRQSYGDLKIPIMYEVDGFYLGRWLRRQEEQYANGTLTQDRAQKLLALGMTLSKKSGWSERYQEAKNYYEKNGHLSISATHATKKEASLYNWLRLQRQAYSKGTLSQPQQEALEALGMVLESPSQIAWKQRFSQVMACYDSMLGKPITTDRVLNNWFQRQKEAVEKGKLKPWQLNMWRTLPRSASVWQQDFPA